MGTLASSVIGEYFDDGYVEALIEREGATGPGLRVCIRVKERSDSLAAIHHAEACLPLLMADMASAEMLAEKAADSSVSATVFDIWIERDGGAAYTCGFLDGEKEDSLVVVQRNKDGELTLA